MEEIKDNRPATTDVSAGPGKDLPNFDANDPKYVEWLHNLTVLGYSENVVIEAEHTGAIQYMFLTKTNPSEALEEYKQFKGFSGRRSVMNYRSITEVMKCPEWDAQNLLLDHIADLKGFAKDNDSEEWTQDFLMMLQNVQAFIEDDMEGGAS